MLLHLVDGAAGNVVQAWRTVREELAAYGGGLADKPELIGLNKLDAMTPREAAARRAPWQRPPGRPVLLLSGATGQGVPEVLRALQSTIDAARATKTLPPLRQGMGGGGSAATAPSPTPSARGGGESRP